MQVSYLHTPYTICSNALSFKSNPFSRTERLIFLDYDGTLSTDINGVQQTLLGLRHTATCITSARSLSNFKIQYLALNDGAFLFENTHNEPLGSWVQTLSYEKQIPEWLNQTQQKTGWSDVKTVVRTIHRILDPMFQDGSVTEGEQSLTLNWIYPNEPKFKLSATKIGDLRKTNAIGLELTKALSEIGIRANFEIEEEDGGKTHSCRLFPAGFSKATPIEFLVSRNPTVKKVITAGNDLNDIPMLTPDSFNGVPNTRIICGVLPLFDQQSLWKKPENIGLGYHLKKLLDN